jgi:hypothetical protein
VTVVPPSFSTMKLRLGTLLEARDYNFRILAALDPGLEQTRFHLLPATGLDCGLRAAFVEAADKGDITTLLNLGELPDIPAVEWQQLPLIKSLLYGMRRRDYNIRVISTEMARLEAILRSIETEPQEYAHLVSLVTQVSLGDPVGCLCAPSANHWHQNGNRFDLIACEILAANDVQWAVEAELAVQVNEGSAPEHGAAWAELLRNDNLYPIWKE